MSAVYPPPIDFSIPFQNNTVGVCYNGTYSGWRDVFYCIDPNFWAMIGLAMVLGTSIIGAAW